jgi:hypothetical protein
MNNIPEEWKHFLGNILFPAGKSARDGVGGGAGDVRLHSSLYYDTKPRPGKGGPDRLFFARIQSD